ncbi:MAG: YggT family protein [Acidithiobacillus ferriphilus]|jgi:YggT family protein|uniref:YggT family protein n=1 Tax=Acidithiobacillus TaxID=119977 RepID=UPI001C07373D|nr:MULTISPECIES: YggT family protein [Acidithiobacillus]MBU2828498.1 YggT family protein [Acidithiobacillus ferriphilus]MBU2846008.1 YggT family protein [Acidithiobacillus ferriphilus]MBU2847437.1 YggT family protein [Acidithiobacillus ferriphilus]MDA8245579.1 YggT family protein [Acidithiobacillus sp.]
MIELSIMAARLTSLVLTLLFWAILIRAVLSWVQPDPRKPIVQFLERVTGPILYPLQRIIPPLGGIDLSPLVAMLLIELLKGLLVNAILNLGG